MNTLLALAWPFSTSVAERLGWLLVHSLWQFALVALVAGVAVRALRRHAATTRYGLLVSAMALLVVAPIATWMLLPSHAPDPSASREALAPAAESSLATGPRAEASLLTGYPPLPDNDLDARAPDVAASNVASEGRSAVSGATAAVVPPPSSWSQQAQTILRPWLTWIVVGWSIGVVLCSARPLLGWHTLRRLQREGLSPAPDETLVALERLSERLGLRRTVRVMQSSLTHVPMLVGYVRPVILLPISLVTSIPAAQLEAILAHELAHVRRHDFLVNLLQTMVETLFFYHPAVWWLSRQIRVEREHCCDDLVVKLLDNRLEYGRALVAIEQLRGQSTVLALGAGDGSMLSRVRRIVGVDREGSQSAAARGNSRCSILCLGALCTLLALIAFRLGIEAAAAQRTTERGQEVAAEPEPPRTERKSMLPPPKPADVRGLDLSKVVVRGWREAYRSTPDLYVRDPADPESWNHPKNVFLMPLAEHTWLKYPAGSGHFYVEHRPGGIPENEQLYGPIDGDPFEILKLEELFRERLKPRATEGDPHYRLRLMFRTGEPGLIRRAARLIEPEVAGKFSRDEEGLYRRLELLETVREALRKEAAAFRKPQLQDVAERLRRVVSAAEAKIDEINDAVPDDGYQSATYLQRKLAAKVPAALWGRPLDGLRLGLVPREWTPGLDWNELPLDTPLPTSITVRPGDELRYQLVVENVSDREIKICGILSGEEEQRTLEVLDGKGKRLEIQSLHTTIPHFRSYWRLKPGERMLISMPAVHFVPVEPGASRDKLGYSVQAAPGKFTLSAGFHFGFLDNGRHRHVPGKSEWIGQLTTGAQEITVADPPAKKDDATKSEGPSAETKPAEGLEFLGPYPKLHGLSLDMTERQFLAIAESQKLKLRKSSHDGGTEYFIATGDDHTVIVMFGTDDDTCHGIQRVRGEEPDAPAPGKDGGKGREPKETGPVRKSRAAPTAEDLLARKVSFTAKEMRLKDALAEVARVAMVELQLDVEALKQVDLDLEQKVTVTIKDKPLAEALAELINWEQHYGALRELRGGKLVITTLQAHQEHIQRHLPAWLKPVYNRGLLAKLDDDHNVVSITAGEAVTDALLAQFKTLPKLQELHIETTKGLTPAGLAHLADLSALEKLSLYSLEYDGKGLGDAAIEQIVGLRSLRELSLGTCGTTDAGVARLEGMSQLRRLSLNGEGRLTDAALASIAKLKRLQLLSLSSYVATEKLGRMRFTETAIRRLSDLQELEELHLVGHAVPADVLVFPRLKALSLGLGLAGMDDACADRIGKLRHLESLDLVYTNITDEGLKKIAELPALTRLNLDSRVATDEGIGHLRRLATLEHLSLRASQLTDESLRHVAEMKRLKRVDLHGSGEPGAIPGERFSIAAVQGLKALPDLRTLWLTNVESSGGYLGLKELAQLRELSLMMTNIRADELEALEEALPNTTIHAATGSGFVRVPKKRMPKAAPTPP